MIAITNPDGKVKSNYSYSDDFRNYDHYDGIGSVIALTNPHGQVNKKYSYDVWGNPTSAPGLLVGKNSYAFTGQQFDSSTNLLSLLESQIL